MPLRRCKTGALPTSCAAKVTQTKHQRLQDYKLAQRKVCYRKRVWANYFAATFLRVQFYLSIHIMMYISDKGGHKDKCLVNVGQGIHTQQKNNLRSLSILFKASCSDCVLVQCDADK